jgi:hypothetical protein
MASEARPSQFVIKRLPRTLGVLVTTNENFPDENFLDIEGLQKI